MINGDPHDFVDTVYSGQNIIYIFHGVKYWFQGWMKGEKGHMEIFRYTPPWDDEGFIWIHDDVSMRKCLEAFLDAPIFDGKTFWEVESEIEWVDD